jgi:hypothetical protein
MAIPQENPRRLPGLPFSLIQKGGSTPLSLGTWFVIDPGGPLPRSFWNGISGIDSKATMTYTAARTYTGQVTGYEQGSVLTGYYIRVCFTFIVNVSLPTVGQAQRSASRTLLLAMG